MGTRAFPFRCVFCFAVSFSSACCVSDHSSLPSVRTSQFIDPAYWNEADGFSTIAPLLFYVSGATMLGVANHHGNISAYAAANVKTVILNAETGERHPHWVELDIYSGNGTAPVLILQPAQPLNHSTRYVVGVRWLVDSSWRVLPANPGFAALRNDTSTLGRAQRFRDAVYPVLAAAGFATADLQLAWDFVTLSRANSLHRVESARDVALAALGSSGPTYRLSKIEGESCAHVYVLAYSPVSCLCLCGVALLSWRTDVVGYATVRASCWVCSTPNNPGTPRIVWGYMKVPFFLAHNRRGQVFPRTAGARPSTMRQTDWFEAGFVFVIPCSLLAAGAPQASTRTLRLY